MRLTAPWTYVRMHGGESSNAFSDDELVTWAERIARYRCEGVDVYAYFNNDPHGDAIHDAERLRALFARLTSVAGGGQEAGEVVVPGGLIVSRPGPGRWPFFDRSGGQIVKSVPEMAIVDVHLVQALRDFRCYEQHRPAPSASWQPGCGEAGSAASLVGAGARPGCWSSCWLQLS